MNSQRTDIIEASKETARIMEQARKAEQETEGRVTGGGGVLASLLIDPARFWASCTDDTLKHLKVIEPSGRAGALALRKMAADLRAGNMDDVRESLLGQGMWLASLAVSLGKEAQATRGNNQYDFDKRVKLTKLALQAQAQGARTLCSAAALGAAGVDVIRATDSKV